MQRRPRRLPDATRSTRCPRCATPGCALTLGSDDPPYFGASDRRRVRRRPEHFGLGERELGDSRAPRSRRASPRPQLRDAPSDQVGRLTPRVAVDCRHWPVPGGTGYARRYKEEQCTAVHIGRFRSLSSWPSAASPWPPVAAATTARRPAAPAQARHRPPPRRRPRRSRSASSPTSAASTTARSTSSPTRASTRRRADLGVDGRVLTSKSNADYVPNLLTLAQQKYDLVIGGRLPDGRRDGEGRQEVPEHEVRDHRLVGGRHEEQAHERRGPAVQGAGGRLPRRLPGRPLRQGQQHQRPSAASAARRSRRSTTTSRATRPAPRRPTRASRRSTATRRTSSIRRSARSSRSTRSPRARRSSSRSPASAASARSTRPRRRASRASASTPTRPTSAPHVLTSALKKVDVAVFNAIKAVQDGKFKGGQDRLRLVKSGGVGSARSTPRARSTPTRSSRSRRRSRPARSPTSRIPSSR